MWTQNKFNEPSSITSKFVKENLKWDLELKGGKGLQSAFDKQMTGISAPIVKLFTVFILPSLGALVY